MKKVIHFLIVFSISSFLFAEETVLFKFKNHPGDSVSHISTVEEAAYLNGRLNNRTQFINRTSTTILEALEDGSAKLDTHYMTTQNTLINNETENLSWGEEDFVQIWRKKNGELFDSNNESLPTVRNIPCFSDNPVKIGESWQCEGLEVHDCRELFGMKDVISIPFVATYTYEKDIKSEETVLQIIKVKYSFEQKTGISERNGTYIGARGYAEQTIYWDNQKGDLDHFNEEFEIELYDVFKNKYLFRGISHGEVTEYKSVNDEETVQKLQETLNNDNLENITVKRGEKGLTISLDSIQFEPDSNILLSSEKEKLIKIGEILKEYSNDLLITGHCAERGSFKARQQLSEERAQAVADFLIKMGIRDQYHIFTQGKGSSEPVASNDTEEGRIKNRRVEIILVD